MDRASSNNAPEQLADARDVPCFGPNSSKAIRSLGRQAPSSPQHRWSRVGSSDGAGNFGRRSVVELEYECSMRFVDRSGSWRDVTYAVMITTRPSVSPKAAGR